jgi:hypothetical protein
MCPTLDRTNLENEFEIEIVEPEVVEEDQGPDPFELEWERDTSDVESLKTNIERANEILDRIQDEFQAGNFSARLVEVAGQIINGITNAGKVLIDNTNYNKYLDIRKQLALLKKREVDIKQLNVDRPKNQNLIVASHQDIMRIVNQRKLTEGNSETKSDSEK